LLKKRQRKLLKRRGGKKDRGGNSEWEGLSVFGKTRTTKGRINGILVKKKVYYHNLLKENLLVAEGEGGRGTIKRSQLRAKNLLGETIGFEEIQFGDV